MNDPRIAALLDANLLSELDAGWARLLARVAGGPLPADLALAAAMLSALQRAGHTSLDLRQTPAELFDESGLAPPALPALSNPWTLPDRHLPILGGPGDTAPLIRDGPRLYLQRHWRDECDVADAIAARTAAPPTSAPSSLPADLWSRPEEAAQRAAAHAALSRPLAVIAGGPGTGKTGCVVRALRAARESGRIIERIAIAAPTGKAVARLREVWTAARTGPAPPVEIATLHRLLGLHPDRVEPRYGPGRPLPHELVVVDEMSMVDLGLMAALVRALRPDARLVLIGDHQQLASVQPGSVFRDLCEGLRAVSPAEDAMGPLIELHHNFRFSAGRPIGRLAAAVRAGDADAALEALRDGGAEAALAELPPRRSLGAQLRERIAVAWAPLLAATTPAEALTALRGFRVLCSHRVGPYGAERVGAELAAAARRGPAGTPLIITANDPARGLYNGDGGVWWRGPAGWGAVIEAEGGVVELPEGRVPPWAPAWALTVHKSQGSEYGEVLLVLPDRDSPLLTRELVYTAITRARRRVEVWAPAPLLAEAIQRTAHRSSGLADAIRRRLSGETTSPPSPRSRTTPTTPLWPQS
ncbi:MAG: exodeoxyribonuclease V subunit alpha [Kiritimatiellae bacterium]|nr:exodeoxyribonuclease V subunit alpha [Kiritimatiellia bacterium]